MHPCRWPAKIDCDGGDSNLKNWAVCMFFYFLNLERFYSCIILAVLSNVFIAIYEHCVSKIWKWPKRNYTHNFLLYFQYDDFLTSFRITVVLFTCVMQVREFLFTRFTLLCKVSAWVLIPLANQTPAIFSAPPPPQALKNLISNRDFCSSKCWKGGVQMMFLIKDGGGGRVGRRNI